MTREDGIESPAENEKVDNVENVVKVTLLQTKLCSLQFDFRKELIKEDFNPKSDIIPEKWLNFSHVMEVHNTRKMVKNSGRNLSEKTTEKTTKNEPETTDSDYNPSNKIFLRGVGAVFDGNSDLSTVLEEGGGVKNSESNSVAVSDLNVTNVRRKSSGVKNSDSNSVEVSGLNVIDVRRKSADMSTQLIPLENMNANGLNVKSVRNKCTKIGAQVTTLENMDNSDLSEMNVRKKCTEICVQLSTFENMILGKGLAYTQTDSEIKPVLKDGNVSSDLMRVGEIDDNVNVDELDNDNSEKMVQKCLVDNENVEIVVE